MDLAPASTLSAPGKPHRGGAGHGRGSASFAASLALAANDPLNTNPNQPSEADAKHQELTRQAQQWVSQTFYGTMLKQMHNSPFKSDLFSGGRGGQAYSELYDQKLIEHISRGGERAAATNGTRKGRGLAAVMVRKLEAAARRKEATAAQTVRPTEQTEGAAQHGVGHSTTMPPAANVRSAVSDPTNPYKNARIHVQGAARS